jgi:hypothetical protein
MATPIEHFFENIARVRSLVGIYNALTPVTTPAIDLSDVLRSAIVLAVSAFDHYVHEMVRIGMLEEHSGRRVKTNAFSNFRVSMDSVTEALAAPSNDEWLDGEVRSQHGWQSFQQAKRVAQAIALISPKPLWDEVARKLSRPTEDVRTQLDLIVDRRNKIAHEADTDPTSPGSRWPIDQSLVETAASFLEDLVQALDTVVN